MNLMWGDRQRPFSGHFRGGIYRPVTAVSPGLEFFLSPLRNACPELGADRAVLYNKPHRLSFSIVVYNFNIIIL